MEIHRLICDVRRRVENEITYEGTERRIKLASMHLDCRRLTYFVFKLPFHDDSTDS